MNDLTEILKQFATVVIIFGALATLNKMIWGYWFNK